MTGDYIIMSFSVSLDPSAWAGQVLKGGLCYVLKT